MNKIGKKPFGRVSRQALEIIRAMAVRQVLAGQSPKAVGRSLGFSRGCVYEWMARYRRGGWMALKARHITGRPQRLTSAQRDWIHETLARKTPQECRLPAANTISQTCISPILWTHSLVRDLIRREFQIPLSLVSVGRLLHQFGLVSRKPWSRFTGQKPSVMEQWWKTEYRQIRSLARQARAEIVFLELTGTESGGVADVESASVNPAPIPPLKCRFISAVSPQGRIRFMIVLHDFPVAPENIGVENPVNRQAGTPALHDGCGQQFLDAFVRRLMQETTRPVYLIAPGGFAGEKSPLQECVTAVGGRLRLFTRPSAAKAPVAHAKPSRGKPARRLELPCGNSPEVPAGFPMVHNPPDGAVYIPPATHRVETTQSGGITL